MKKLLIICNGPSTKNLDWEFLKQNKNKVDTFCLNSCYRKFEELGFYPTYFGCFDYKVGKYHEKEFQKLLLDGKNGIKYFFFLNNLKLKDPFKRLRTVHIKTNGVKRLSNNLNNYNNWLNSGANSLQISIMMKYKDIYLIGADGYKKDIVNEAKKIGNGAELMMTKTPDKNPNYFFDDYQRKNDIFNRVQQQKFQFPGWIIGKIVAGRRKVKIQNMGNKNYLHFFKNIDLDTFYNQVNNMSIKVKAQKGLINQKRKQANAIKLKRLRRLRRLVRN